MGESRAIEYQEDWEEILFKSDEEIKVGQRLGVPFKRTMQSCLQINLINEKINIHQESSGSMAITGVVWDAGLLFVDFLISCYKEEKNLNCYSGKILDLGCGTGVVGIVAAKLGWAEVSFTDRVMLECLNKNMETLLSQECNDKRVSFIPYEWESKNIPFELRSNWNTIFASDVLYDEKFHESLIFFLRSITFERIIFSYKKRHAEAERDFFKNLSTWCKISVIPPASIQLRNLTKDQVDGLFLVMVEPKTKFEIG